MCKLGVVLTVLAALCASTLASVQEAQKPSGPLTGRWTVTSDFHGTPLYFKLELAQQGEKLTGNFDGDKLEGTVSGSNIQFLARDQHGGTEDAKGSVKGGTISGSVVFTKGDDPTHP